MGKQKRSRLMICHQFLAWMCKSNSFAIYNGRSRSERTNEKWRWNGDVVFDFASRIVWAIKTTSETPPKWFGGNENWHWAIYMFLFAFVYFDLIISFLCFFLNSFFLVGSRFNFDFVCVYAFDFCLRFCEPQWIHLAFIDRSLRIFTQSVRLSISHVFSLTLSFPRSILVRSCCHHFSLIFFQLFYSHFLFAIFPRCMMHFFNTSLSLFSLCSIKCNFSSSHSIFDTMCSFRSRH